MCPRAGQPMGRTFAAPAPPFFRLGPDGFRRSPSLSPLTTMTKKKTALAAPYQRRTMPLSGTVTRLEIQLDHGSALALAYSRQWLRSGPPATGVDPLASGVLRRAIQHYAGYLNAPGTDPQAEARAVRSCCRALSPAPEEREAALRRLQGHQPGQPFPAWLDVLYGFDRAERWAAFDERVEELVKTCSRTAPTINKKESAT